MINYIIINKNLIKNMTDYPKKWRLINSGACSAYYNMALDEAIAIHVKEGKAIPTLRLYKWDRPSVSLGCFQKNADVDMVYCADAGIPIVRRPTGGRAILHNKELTYSFSIRTNNEFFSKGIFDSYKKISRALYLALQKVGIKPEIKMERNTSRQKIKGSPLCFQSTSYGELTIEGRKMAGSAQKRWNDGLLQQGSLPYLIDIPLIHKVFRLKDMRAEDFVMTGLMDVLPALKEETLMESIKKAFEEVFGIDIISAHPSEGEEALALRLQEEKYQTPEWTLRQ